MFLILIATLIIGIAGGTSLAFFSGETNSSNVISGVVVIIEEEVVETQEGLLMLVRYTLIKHQWNTIILMVFIHMMDTYWNMIQIKKVVKGI